MANQTWVKSDDGNFIAADKVTHLKVQPDGNSLVYVEGNTNVAGVFASPKRFFDALQHGLIRADIDG
jgi:hypothetical protein